MYFIGCLVFLNRNHKYDHCWVCSLNIWVDSILIREHINKWCWLAQNFKVRKIRFLQSCDTDLTILFKTTRNKLKKKSFCSLFKNEYDIQRTLCRRLNMADLLKQGLSAEVWQQHTTPGFSFPDVMIGCLSLFYNFIQVSYCQWDQTSKHVTKMSSLVLFLNFNGLNDYWSIEKTTCRLSDRTLQPCSPAHLYSLHCFTSTVWLQLLSTEWHTPPNLHPCLLLAFSSLVTSN